MELVLHGGDESHPAALLGTDAECEVGAIISQGFDGLPGIAGIDPHGELGETLAEFPENRGKNVLTANDVRGDAQLSAPPVTPELQLLPRGAHALQDGIGIDAKLLTGGGERYLAGSPLEKAATEICFQRLQAVADPGTE